MNSFGSQTDKRPIIVFTLCREASLQDYCILGAIKLEIIILGRLLQISGIEPSGQNEIEEN